MARGFGTTWGAASTDKVVTTLTSNPTIFTISSWLYNDTGGHSLPRAWSKAGNHDLYETSSKYKFIQTFSITNGDWTTFGIPAEATWEHFFMTYDGTTDTNDPNFYFDNSLDNESTATQSVGTMSTNAAAWTIGNIDTIDRVWGGGIAEWAIWNRVLNSTERGNLAGGAWPSTISSGLLSYISFYEGTEDTENTDPTVTGTANMAHPSAIDPRGTTIMVPKGPRRNRV